MALLFILFLTFCLLLLTHSYHSGSIITVILTIIHSLGAYRSHVVITRRNCPYGVIIGLPAISQIIKQINTIVAHIEGYWRCSILDPIHTGDLFCAWVLNFKSGRYHITDHHVIYTAAIAFLNCYLYYHQVVLCK